MKIPYNTVYQINTITIHSDTIFSELELVYLKALSYTIDQFNQIDNGDQVFCLNLGNGNFLIGNHSDSEKINPFVFVNKRGDLVFDMDISCFRKEINEFRKYIEYEGSKNERKNWPLMKKYKAAIKEYKNDFLDFNIHNELIAEQLIKKARSLYADLHLEIDNSNEEIEREE